MSLDPATNSMAVTGGEDDKAYVWRVSDGEVLLECTGELKADYYSQFKYIRLHPSRIDTSSVFFSPPKVTKTP